MTADGQAQAGEKLTYTYTITNFSDVKLSPVELVDPQLNATSLSCDATTHLGHPFTLVASPDNALAATDYVSCHGKHTVTVPEATAGHVANTATTTGYSPDITPTLPKGIPWQSTATATWDNTPSANQPLKGQIELTKTAVHNDSNGNGVFNIPETVTYGFIVRNVGTSLLSNIVVTDPSLPSPTYLITCLANSLAVNAFTTCTVSPAYPLTVSDVTAGRVVNTATAIGTDPNGNPVVDTDSHVLNSGEPAALELEKTAVLTAGLTVGDPIAYTLVATNTGGVALTSVTVSDNLLGSLTGACTPPLGAAINPGEQMVCQRNYTVQTGEANPIDNLASTSGLVVGRSQPVLAATNHVVPYIGPIAKLYTVGNLGGPIEVNVNVAASPGNVTNTADVTRLTGEPSFSNNTATATVTVTQP